MNAIIAATLIDANQYSSSPKTPTCAVLIATRTAAIAITQHHDGTLGNQNAK